MEAEERRRSAAFLLLVVALEVLENRDVDLALWGGHEHPMAAVDPGVVSGFAHFN